MTGKLGRLKLLPKASRLFFCAFCSYFCQIEARKLNSLIQHLEIYSIIFENFKIKDNM